ncbi:MAG: hypothetical protein AAGG59_03030 [Bacteroidota bacterium]
MKIFQIKYIAFLCILIGVGACETDVETALETVDRGGTVKATVDPDHSSINLLADIETLTVEFDLQPFDANGNDGDLIDRLEISLQFTPNGGATTEPVLISTETDLNGRVVYQVTDMIALVEGLTAEDLGPSDMFTLSFNVVMTDGREFGPANTAAAICGTAGSNGTCTINIPAICPSNVEEFEGSYSSEITASSFGGFIGSTNDVTITFSGPEPFRYTISDISALAYAPFGGVAYPGDIFDICGVPQMQPTSTFGRTTDTGGGTWDPVNGVLTLNVFESNNSISWTIVFTKK